MALITVLDEQMQYIQFRAGLKDDEQILNDAFCRYTIENESVFEVHNALHDKRFCNNPLVIGDINLRFYAGAPLTTRDGYMLGCLSVIGREPHMFHANQKKMLLALCRQIIQIIEFDVSISLLKDKVHELKLSEVKLRSFFESTVSCHLLIGKKLELLAYDKIVADFTRENVGVEIREKYLLLTFFMLIIARCIC